MSATWGLKITILFFAILHFATYFYPKPMMVNLLSVCGFLILFFAAFAFKLKQLKMPLTLFLSSLIVLIFSDISIVDFFFLGFLQMRNMIGLLIIIPMISWVLKEEPYVESIIKFARRMLDSSRKMYFGIMIFTQIIAYFLLFGSIPMMYQFVNMILKNEKGEVWEHFKGTAILRGFALSVMWVVSIPSFIFAVEALNASLWKSILQGLGIALLGIITALIFSHFEEKRYKVDLTSILKHDIDDLIGHIVSHKNPKLLVIEFSVLCVAFFGLIFLLHSILPIELMILIPIIVFALTTFYYLIKRRVWNYVKKGQEHFEKHLVKESYQLCVMLSAGTLIYTLNQAGFGEAVVNGINQMHELFPFINVLFLLPFMVIIPGFFG